MQAIVIHRGRRDEYQVADALAEAGYEVTLVTSGYGTPAVKLIANLFKFHKLKKLAARRAKQNITVRSGLLNELVALFLQRILGEGFAHTFIVNRMTKAALREIGPQTALVVAYNYSAYEIFVDPRTFNTKKILFQCHPHPGLIEQIVRNGSRQGLFPLENGEKEFSYSKSVLSKLIAEPHVADHVICASTFTKSSLIYTGIGDASISVIPYGVSSAFSGPPSPPKKSRENGGQPLRVIFVGQFVYRKGILLIPKILEIISFPIEITFVGRGNRESSPEFLIKAPNAQVRTFWDISHDQLVKLYSESDVFLFPSFIEGFAHVILESMRAGCIPVVSSATCGPDVIENWIDGVTIAKQDPDDYAAALEKIYAECNIEAMSAAARQKATSYTWERFRSTFSERINSIRNGSIKSQSELNFKRYEDSQFHP
ncbi:glycosyltransferase family 4 protein [Ideonella sp. B7]|uniref:glycosyltransferase family 4 protein n=1 Tax=Ideonella benzenivorans TaxID=2831643 RepID=UPI001CEC950E|nr:glycosyltransferase family 4 protein [Ideonella benzenivorans]MCA6218229.1 glycosyltransferase family 4 protein [Ideonella benzenivorans]